MVREKSVVVGPTIRRRPTAHGLEQKERDSPARYAPLRPSRRTTTSWTGRFCVPHWACSSVGRAPKNILVDRIVRPPSGSGPPDEGYRFIIGRAKVRILPGPRRSKGGY